MSRESKLKEQVEAAYARVQETLTDAGKKMDERLRELKTKAAGIAPPRATSHTNLKPVR